MRLVIMRPLAYEILRFFRESKNTEVFSFGEIKKRIGITNNTNLAKAINELLEYPLISRTAHGRYKLLKGNNEEIFRWDLIRFLQSKRSKYIPSNSYNPILGESFFCDLPREIVSVLMADTRLWQQVEDLATECFRTISDYLESCPDPRLKRLGDKIIDQNKSVLILPITGFGGYKEDGTLDYPTDEAPVSY